MTKTLWLILGSKWISNFGTQLHMLALPLIIYQQTQSVKLLSLSFIAETMPWLLIGPFAPHFLQPRMKARSVLILCDILRSALVIGVIFFIKSNWAVLALMFVIGTLNSIYGSFRTGIVKSNASDINMGKVLGLSLGVDDLLSIVAPPLGAALISAGVSAQTLLGMDAFSYLLSGIMIACIQTTDENSASQSSRVQIWKGFKAIWSNRRLRWLTSIEALRSLIEGITIPLLMLYVVQFLSGGERTFVWSRAISSGCAVVASLLYMRFSASVAKHRFVQGGTVLILLSLLLIIGSHRIEIFFLASAVLGIGMAIRQLVAENLLIDETHVEMLPQVASAYNSAIASFYLFGYGLSLLQTYGWPATVFFEMAVILLILGHFVFRFLLVAETTELEITQ